MSEQSVEEFSNMKKLLGDNKEAKQRMMREAAVVALKNQSEWHRPDDGFYQPTIEEINKRIVQVALYDDQDYAPLRAMKDVVLNCLSFRLQAQSRLNDLQDKTFWGRIRRLFSWK